MLEIIEYRSRYLEQLVELNKSLITNWYDLNSMQNRKSWEDLTPMQRFRHGGPWLDLDTLQVHISEMQKMGNIKLLINESDEILGELEYHTNLNRVHLDWMMVDPKHQRLGLGSKAILWMVTHIASKYEAIITEPEEGVKNFYLSNSFEEEKPQYMRYVIKSNSQSNDWINDKISIDRLGTRVGEANNDDEYLKLLINTGIKYAEIFEIGFPIYFLNLKDVTMVRRDLPSLSNKSSIFYYMEGKQRSMGQLTFSLPYQRSCYFTSLGEYTDFSRPWAEFSRIDRLKLNF